jgi:hypothetical protein
VHANGVIRDFYETLKEGIKTVIDRIILTGRRRIIVFENPKLFDPHDLLGVYRRTVTP